MTTHAMLALQVLPRVDPKNQENVVLGLLLVPASAQNGENEDDQRCLKHHLYYHVYKYLVETIYNNITTGV